MALLAIRSIFKRRKNQLRYYDVTFFYGDKDARTFELRTANEDERSRLAPELSGKYFYGKFAVPVSEEEAMSYIKGGAPLPQMIVAKTEQSDGDHPYADIGGHSHNSDNRGGHNDHGGAGGDYKGDGTHDAPHDHNDHESHSDHNDHDSHGNERGGGGHDR